MNVKILCINQNQRCDILIQAKAFIVVLVIVTTVATYVIYTKAWDFEILSTLPESSPLNSLNEDNEEYLINTPGCQIPNIKFQWSDHTKSKDKINCGPRAIFLKVLTDDKIRLSIKPTLLKVHLSRASYQYCCVSEILRPKGRDNEITYSQCQSFKKEITIQPESDFLHVKCYAKSRKRLKLFYEDTLNWIKKNNFGQMENNTESWSVLIFGMDTMSRSKLMTMMPNTYSFLKELGFIDFKGFNKIGDNTFPNLMAMLSGKNDTSAAHVCTKHMDECNKIIIWSRFKKYGYVTAYGEDYLSLPDTFAGYGGFHSLPTDHYARPMFIQREKAKYLKYTNLLCAGKISSGEQLVNYAKEFSRTYIDRKSFGFFWMNSFSHNPKNAPHLIDNPVKNMLSILEKNGVMNRSFIFFLSDHGIRFGDERNKIGGYYVERLPSLFIWIPTSFKQKYPEAQSMIIGNENRLVTHYDVFATLEDILQRSTASSHKVEESKGCKEARSLFSSIPETRTCPDACISEKWCTCHSLLPINDTLTLASVDFAFKHIRHISSGVKTLKCWKCADFQLKSTIKTYYYNVGSLTYYIVSFTLEPGSHNYEAVVSYDNKDFKLVGGVSTTVLYSGTGTCVKAKSLKAFCHCETTECDKKNNDKKL